MHHGFAIHWIRQARWNYATKFFTNTNTTIIIIITITTREVDELEARLWAELHGFNYFATSAASGTGVTDMFQAMIIIIMIIIVIIMIMMIIILITKIITTIPTQAFFSYLVSLVESGLGTKTPRQGKKQVVLTSIMIILTMMKMMITMKIMMMINQVGTVTKMRDRMTASPPVLSPQPSAAFNVPNLLLNC